MSVAGRIAREARASARVLAGRQRPVELFYWSPPGEGRENFGDYVSSLVVRETARRQGVDPGASRIPRHRFWERPQRLLAVGSILHFAGEGDTVWGSGVNGKKLGAGYAVPGLDVRMVRGPLTRQVLRREGVPCPQVYGDPALLLSDLLPRERPAEPTRDYVFVPNLNDLPLYEGSEEHMVSPLLGVEEVVDRILEARLVVSGSLHGLVVAESYGVPARHLLSPSEPVFKYRDYYEGTGRSGYRFAQSMQEALELGGEDPPQADRGAMYRAFPDDLWKGRVG